MKEYKIKMEDVKLEDVHSIDLVLEPMEAFTVYNSEIVALKFEFDEQLVIGTSCIERKIKSGYLKLAIDDKIKRYKSDVIINNENGGNIKKPYKSKVEKRLIDKCDICYLTITEKENYWTENLDVCLEQDEDYNILSGPNAEMDKDGYLVIYFGESSKNR